jgi:hypothetical protein
MMNKKFFCPPCNMETFQKSLIVSLQFMNVKIAEPKEHTPF